MKYDDASWHAGGDFPPDLPPEAGATHIGMFFAWALLSGLGSEFSEEERTDQLKLLTARTVSPAEFFLTACDGKLVDEDLSDEGNAFARDYFEQKYIEDYEEILGDELPTLYHVPDTWETYDVLKPLLDKRFMKWRSSR